MSRRVKEFVDIIEHISLDELIGWLVEIRKGLPDNSEAELRLRGDDVFGRKLTISYMREQTDEEAAVERRYARSAAEARERELNRLDEEFAELCQRRANLDALRKVA